MIAVILTPKNEYEQLLLSLVSNYNINMGKTKNILARLPFQTRINLVAILLVETSMDFTIHYSFPLKFHSCLSS